VQGTSSAIDRYPASGYETGSYGLGSAKTPLSTGRVVDLTNPGGVQNVATQDGSRAISQVHHSVGEVRPHYDDDEVSTGILSMTGPECGDLYGVPQEGVGHPHDKFLGSVDVSTDSSDRRSLAVGALQDSRSSPSPSDFSSRPTLINPSAGISSSGTTTLVGNTKLYNLMSTSGNGIHGTSVDFGTMDFDNLYSTTGDRLSGSGFFHRRAAVNLPSADEVDLPRKR
jgi:hypothetical protein